MDINTNAGSTEARLEELLKKQEKMLKITRLSGLAVLALAVAIVIACVILVPKAVSTMMQIESLAQEASVLVENANTTLEGIDEMSAEIKTAADGINGLVEDNSSVLTESMTKLNSIDFEGLNAAITDLGAVVEPMARFFGKFK
ncbi:MAG: hypothetical protein IJS12_00125 [Lachnospiraceae bacterium]|nr:hypothetical protein [Lachnospiraceae bacterium]